MHPNEMGISAIVLCVYVTNNLHFCTLAIINRPAYRPIDGKEPKSV